MSTITSDRLDYVYVPGKGPERVVPDSTDKCANDTCEYREVTPHGLRSAAFVQCANCGHCGWVIVPHGE